MAGSQTQSKRQAAAQTPPDLESVVQSLREHMSELHERYGVSFLGVFGSYVRGEQSQGSDLDILVEFDRIPTLFEFVRLERHLSQLLDVKVDLVMKSALKPTIGSYILKETVPV
jgi:hypothetical protein